MKKYSVHILMGVVLGIVMACEPTRPEGVLEPEKMEMLLIELIQAQSKLSTSTLPSDSSYQIFEYRKQQLFRKHGIPESTYLKSMGYYLEHSEEFVAVYENIIDSLQLKLKLEEAKFESAIKAKQDTVEKAVNFQEIKE